MPPRFYLLHGPDEFASAEALDQLKSKMGDPALAALNTTLFDGRSVTLGELRTACETVPFLAERRMVIVEGWLTKLLGKGESDEGEPAAETGTAKETLASLAEYLPSLPPTTALIFIEKRAIPERNVVIRAAAEGGWALIRFSDVPKGDALVSWIRARAKAEGGEFTRDAAQALASVESGPRALGSEIVKLLTYVNFTRPVEAADVEALTPAGGETRVFDMVDAIGQRRGPAALRELKKLLDREEPLYVLGMIVRQFRLMLQAKELLADARAGEAEVARALGLHPFPAGKVCAQARTFALADLEHIYRGLLAYDVEIKTGQVEAGAALDALVAGLTAA